MSAQRVSNSTTVKKYSTEEIQKSAAEKIQKFLQKYTKSYHTKKCIKDNELEVNADNIYICFNKDEDKTEIPIINFFRFKETEDIKAEFFTEFNKYMYDSVTPETNLVCKVQLVDTKLFIYPHLDIIYNDATKLKDYVYRFIFYNLINLKDKLHLKKKITLVINHPKKFSELTAGIHKDDCTYTCITYIKSVVTTEIAFDTTATELHWLKCSPIFRFNTIGQITTLCFSDKYISHTAPFYEKEGIEPHELNKLDKNETIRYKNIDGKSHLDTGYFIGDPERSPEYRFTVPLNRKKIEPSKDREILVLHTYDSIYDAYWTNDLFHNVETYDIAELREKYEIPVVQYKLQLSERTVELIENSESLGDFTLMGGRNKNKTKRRNKIQGNKYSSKKNKKYNIRKTKKR